MVRIPQHTSAGNLNDLQSFQEHLEGFQRQIDYWVIEAIEITGHGGLAFEELTAGGSKLSPKAFASFCLCINQTIDGVFTAFIDNLEIVKLEAVDSSYWEVTGSPEFENLMLEEYGSFVS